MNHRGAETQRKGCFILNQGLNPDDSIRDSLTHAIIAGAIEVHRHLGPCLLESAYEECLSWELRQSGLVIERQVPLPITYKQVKLELGYRLDMLIEKQVIVELKTVERLMPIHEAQLLTYLRLTGVKKICF